MEFGVIGVRYKEADLEIREKVSFTDTKKMALFEMLKEQGIIQSMILSTCNRSEIYFIYERESQKKEVKKAYETLFSGLVLEPYMIEKQGKEAISYLFRVAAGLESLVLGEDQILGQTAEAGNFSKEMGFSKKEMNKIVRDAITCAKKIKTELKISEHPLSISYIGLKKLNEQCPLSQKKVLLIGSGKMAFLALQYLIEYEAGEIIVCSRSMEHSKELKNKFPNIQICRFEERYEAMKFCHAVISATSAPHLIIERKKVEKVSHVRYLLDLATPRDIDPKLKKEENIYLFDIDALNQTAMENQRQRETLVKQGTEIIEADVTETMEWLRNSRVDTAIKSLQNCCSEIVEDTFSYLNRKIELNEREKGILKKTLHASLQRLIREPILTLKQLEDTKEQDTYMNVVHQLFHISE